MKKTTKTNLGVARLVSASAMIASFVILPNLSADDETEIKIKKDKIEVKVDGGKAEIKTNGEVEVDGKNGEQALRIARQALGEEEAKAFQNSLRRGYVVPKDRYVYLDPVPETIVTRIPVRENVTYRTYNGIVYAIDPKTYTVIDVVETDSAGNSIRATVPASAIETQPRTTTTTTTTEVITKGYVIPRERYTTFTEVPVTIVPRLRPVPQGMVYRYYNNRVYLVNPENYTVVDVITVE